MSEEYSKLPESSETANAREILDSFEKAKSENYQFGTAAEKLSAWLLKYKLGDVFPDNFWVLYQNFAHSANKDSTGKLLYTGTQGSIMTFINFLMKRGGLAITLPAKEVLHQELSSAANKFPYQPYLEKAFFSPFLTKSGQSMESHYFLTLIELGMNNGLEIIKNKDRLVETVGMNDAYEILIDVEPLTEITTLHFPNVLIDVFWKNSQVAEYTKLMHSVSTSVHE